MSENDVENNEFCGKTENCSITIPFGTKKLCRREGINISSTCRRALTKALFERKMERMTEERQLRSIQSDSEK